MIAVHTTGDFVIRGPKNHRRGIRNNQGMGRTLNGPPRDSSPIPWRCICHLEVVYESRRSTLGWACAHTAQRLMLNRVRMPITNLPVVIPRNAPVIGLQNGRPAAQSAWASAIEKVNSKQAELKQRAAATINWGSVVEKLCIALKQQAGGARAEALARAVETLRGRQPGLPVRMADREFNRVWDGQCPEGSALNLY